MRFIRAVAGEVVVSLLSILLGTSLMFAVTYYASTDKQRQGLRRNTQEISVSTEEIPLSTAYLEWWGRIIRGDVAGEDQSYEFFMMQTKSATGYTAVLVCFSLIISVVAGVAVALLFLNFEGRWYVNVLERLGNLSGAVPVFLIAALVWLFVDGRMPSLIIVEEHGLWMNLFPLLAAAVILSVGSGAMGELVRVTKVELKRILNEPYLLAARARNANIPFHAARAAIVPLSSAVLAKVPYFLGASIIVELVWGIKGLGPLLKQSAEDGNFPKLMFISLIILSIVVLSRLANKTITVLCDPRGT
jgi:peptide/nickel transport system permease protein